MSRGSFNIAAKALRVANLGEFSSAEEWAARAGLPDPALKPERCAHLPMMQARRLKPGSRMAADLGYELLSCDPDFIVFSSRHGELERNFSILDALAHDADVSPTDFSMSVHNAAAGILTVVAGRKIPLSSVSAGTDSFVQALFEGMAALQDHRRVLIVDFDGAIPEFFMRDLPQDTPRFPYAAGLIIERGADWSVAPAAAQEPQTPDDPWPQSLSFMRHLIKGEREFAVNGEFGLWHFARTSS